MAMGWSLSEEGIQMLMLSGQDKVGALPPPCYLSTSYSKGRADLEAGP